MTEIFWSIVTHKKNQKKPKEMVCGINWKISEKRGLLKHIWREVIREKLMFRMLWNTLKDGLHYQRNESVSIKVFLLNMHKATDFISSRQSYTSFNLLCILNFFYKKLNFFYKNCWPHLPSSSKCRRSICHGDIKVLDFQECLHK